MFADPFNDLCDDRFLMVQILDQHLRRCRVACSTRTCFFDQSSALSSSNPKSSSREDGGPYTWLFDVSPPLQLQGIHVLRNANEETGKIAILMWFNQSSAISPLTQPFNPTNQQILDRITQYSTRSWLSLSRPVPLATS